MLVDMSWSTLVWSVILGLLILPRLYLMYKQSKKGNVEATSTLTQEELNSLRLQRVQELQVTNDAVAAEAVEKRKKILLEEVKQKTKKR